MYFYHNYTIAMGRNSGSFASLQVTPRMFFF